MKKIKLSVVGLMLSGLSYSQCTNSKQDSIILHKYQKNVKMFKEIKYRIDDIIDAIRMDIFYGRITQENGMYYIKEVSVLKSKNEDLMVNLFTHKIERIEIECENCDEID